MIIVGLTGSIGMGKSTVARMFADFGLPVFDADAAVHVLYAPGGAAVAPIARRFADVVVNGGVDRERLSAILRQDPSAFTALEAIVHPLVGRARRGFLSAARLSRAPAAILDIPLLFETGGERRVDRVLVVSAPSEVQRARVLARPGMTAAKFDAILARQIGDSIKRARADRLIDTAGSLSRTQIQVHQIARYLERLNEVRRPRRARHRIRR